MSTRDGIVAFHQNGSAELTIIRHDHTGVIEKHPTNGDPATRRLLQLLLVFLIASSRGCDARCEWGGNASASSR